MKTAIIVLGGWLKKDGFGHWHTTLFDSLGDRLRVEAAVILAKKYPHAHLIASGGKGKLRALRGAPTLARIIKQELIGRGVLYRRIISEPRSGTTFAQLWHAAPLLHSKGFRRSLYVSNRYHLPRVRAMLQYHEALKQRMRRIQPVFLSAEDILIKENSSHWRAIISTAYRSPRIKKLAMQERLGVAMIKKGTYRYTLV